MQQAKILIESGFGWSEYKEEWGDFWLKGYCYGPQKMASVARNIAKMAEEEAYKKIDNYLNDLDGHFSLVINTEKIWFAAVDRIRSVPLFFVERSNEVLITDQPEKLIGWLSADELRLNKDAETVMRMSGYCSGSDTLLGGLVQIQSGEYIVHAKNTGLINRLYYSYSPYSKDKDQKDLEDNLTVTTLSILQKIIDSVDERMIVIPLSGGYDSRVVASGLAHLGYKNIKCFSYGIKNNHESAISQLVAKKLGFPWKFVELSHQVVREDYFSEEHADYLKFSNTFASVQVEHEYSAVRLLKFSGWIPDDAIFINGMSGDFLTGSHIPKVLQETENKLGVSERRLQILNALFDRHYSLWKVLKTQQNKDLVFKKIWEEIEGEVKGLPNNQEDDFGLYEFSEFKNRQTKYVITVQRIYEFFGYDWRLPLWDNQYLDFWIEVSLKHKVNRKLFVETMKRQNWGNVWSAEYPSSYVTPKWIAKIRFIFKIFFFFFGKKMWKAFDRRIFYYWTETLCKLGVVPYRQVLLDKNGYRNAVSWLVEKYAERVRNNLSLYRNSND